MTVALTADVIDRGYIVYQISLFSSHLCCFSFFAILFSPLPSSREQVADGPRSLGGLEGLG